jgi:nucleoid DNA-binding protein
VKKLRYVQLMTVAGRKATVRVDVAAHPAVSSLPRRSPTIMPKPAAPKKTLTKSAILNAVSETIGEDLPKKHVKQVVETLVAIGHKELKKNGVFVLPGFAKFVVVKKPAKPARKGINPFTKQEQTFAAKPASKTVKARAVKAIKDAVA